MESRPIPPKVAVQQFTLKLTPIDANVTDALKPAVSLDRLSPDLMGEAFVKA
jgi:hypothetical protein